MLKKEFKLGNKSGLHVRPASVLASGISHFESEINVHFNGSDYNAKSVINMLAAGIKVNDTITVTIDGEDEKEAMDKIEKLIASGLGE